MVELHILTSIISKSPLIVKNSGKMNLLPSLLPNQTNRAPFSRRDEPYIYSMIKYTTSQFVLKIRHIPHVMFAGTYPLAQPFEFDSHFQLNIPSLFPKSLDYKKYR